MQSRTCLMGRNSPPWIRGGRRIGVLGLLCLVAVALGYAAVAEQTPVQTVDKGSFGVFIGGKRVATETFSVEQGALGSSVTSHFLTESGVEKAAQNSELELGPNGDLRSYQWTETSPGQAQAWVLPNHEFLTERYSKSPQDKMQEQPFLLPVSISILDDYFLVQREVLAWRYLASSCRQEKGQVSCPLNQAVPMGTLNAHSRISNLVQVEYSGREKVSIRGAERELIRLNLKTEGGDWALWLDDQLKLERLVDLSSNTEVIRD
jgi:hypothetical protein